MQENRRPEERERKKDTEFLTRLNVALTSDHDYRSNMDKALKMIGDYCGNDRIQVIKIYPNMTFSILHEWCNRNVIPFRDKIKKHRCFYDKDLENQLNVHDYIRIEDPEKLGCQELSNFLHTCGIQTTLLFPLFTRHLFSFLTFSQCKAKKEWSEKEIHLFHLFSAIIAANLEKNVIIYRLLHKQSHHAASAPDIH